MKSVLDSIFIRRPRINYISPPICEVIFSSSAFPIIVLNPIHKKKGPTGLVIGGRGHVRLRWNIFPGALCYNVYVSGLISPDVSECHNADGSDCADPTTGRCTCCQCSDVLTLLAECIQFPEDGFPIAEFGCYYLSAITVDGESELSDPYCFNRVTAHCEAPFVFNPATFSCECPAIVCPDGQTQNQLTCACEPCPVQDCDPGFHWDTSTCMCVPDGGCTSFIDVIPFTVSDLTTGGLAVGQDTSLSVAWVYVDRVSQAQTFYSPAGNSFFQVGGGARYAFGWATDQTFSVDTAYSFDITTSTVQAVGSFPSDNDIRCANEIGNAVWGGFQDGFGHTGGKLYAFGSNSFIADIVATANNASVTDPYHMNDSNTVLVNVGFSAFGPFANQNRAMLYHGGVFTDIHIGVNANQRNDSVRGWINQPGHAIYSLVTLAVNWRPVVYLGGAPFSPEGDLVNQISRMCLNDNDVAIWDRLSTNQIKTWDAINGVKVLLVTGRLGGTFDAGTIGSNNYKTLNNSGLAVGTLTAGGGFVYRLSDDFLFNAIDLLPPGHGWTSIDEVWAITEDNYIAGFGVKGGISQFFVAKICP